MWWGSRPSTLTLAVFCVHREVFKGAHLGKLVSHIWRGRGQGPKEKVSLRHHGMAAFELIVPQEGYYQSPSYCTVPF